MPKIRARTPHGKWKTFESEQHIINYHRKVRLCESQIPLYKDSLRYTDSTDTYTPTYHPRYNNAESQRVG